MSVRKNAKITLEFLAKVEWMRGNKVVSSTLLPFNCHFYLRNA
jgi:hypothetical protein